VGLINLRKRAMPNNTSQATGIFQEACKHLVGGVNSPVRAFKAVGGEPFFVESAAGSRLKDSEGREYIDYVMSWGANILGHAPMALVDAIGAAASKGTSFGAPTAKEIELAVLVKQAFPHTERVRFVNSGTEAVMSAVRLARGFTGRGKILKFDGCYHGHSDSLLVKAGSGGATFGTPDSAGVPEELAKLTVSLPYNQIEAVEALFKNEPDSIACILLEPIACNMGLVLPKPGFLRRLRELATEYGAILIFDEVISGFRASFGGAQQLFGVEADLTCLGKILGGGIPLAAFAGKQSIMSRLSPEGDVYQAGTLSGNPLATACGITMLNILRDEDPYAELEQKRELLFSRIEPAIQSAGYPVRLQGLGSLFTVFFTEREVFDFEDAKATDRDKYGQFFHALLKRGVFFPPSQFEGCFISRAHSAADLEQTATAMLEALAEVFGG